jgi:hypothetical protein
MYDVMILVVKGVPQIYCGQVLYDENKKLGLKNGRTLKVGLLTNVRLMLHQR